MTTDERAEFGDAVLAELRELLDPARRYKSLHGGREQHGVVGSVESEDSGTEQGIVLLLRDLNRPGCLFGWRSPVWWPDDPVMEAPDLTATVIRANLEEDILAVGNGLLEDCSPARVNWF